jgi:hypothetical protein
MYGMVKRPRENMILYKKNKKNTIVCMIENAFKAILILLDIIIIYHEGTIKNL